MSNLRKSQAASGTHSVENHTMNRPSTARRVLPAALALALTASVSTTAQAIEFSSGELTGSFDTTVSYGAIWRASDLDTDNVGKAYWNPLDFLLTNEERRQSPGRWSVNNDDGNRNYAKGGEIVLAGFYSTAISFAFPPAFMKEARLRIAAEWTPRDMLATRTLIEDGYLSLDGLITHTRPAIKAREAYETAFGDPACLKMILDWKGHA